MIEGGHEEAGSSRRCYLTVSAEGVMAVHALNRMLAQERPISVRIA